MSICQQVHRKETQAATFTSGQTSLLQRKCACGGTPGVDDKCTPCRAKWQSLQRQVAADNEFAPAPPTAHAVLRSPGQPLTVSTQGYGEPHFGYNFRQMSAGAPPTARSRAPGREMPEEQTMATATSSANSIKLAFDVTKMRPRPKCDRVLFVQMIQHTADGTPLLPSAYWSGYACRDSTALPTGHYMDHSCNNAPQPLPSGFSSLSDWKTPYAADYGQGNATNAEGSQVVATLEDTVNTGGGDKGFRSATNPNGWQKVVFHFESYAFCALGRQCGAWYDGVAWDYTKTDADAAAPRAGAVSVLGNLAPPGPGATVIQAFNQFNTAKGFTPCPPKK